MAKNKTDGHEWLWYSVMAFNGSGYADMDSPESFYDSYVAYKQYRKDSKAVRLAEIYHDEILLSITQLLKNTYGAGRIPARPV